MRLIPDSGIAAGVALAGASVIAITPSVASNLEMQQHAVALATAASDAVDITASAASGLIDAAKVPLADTTIYPVVGLDTLVTETFTNLQQLLAMALDDPFPVLSQVAANQFDYAQILATGAVDSVTKGVIPFYEGLPAAVNYALSLPYGDFFNGLTYVANYIMVDGLQNTLYPPALAIQTVLEDIGDHLSNVVNDGDAYKELLMAPQYPLNAALVAFSGVAANFLHGWNEGNAGLVFNSLLNAPLTVLSGFLNGYPVDCQYCEIPPDWGLLTGPTFTIVVPPDQDPDPGTIYSIMEALRLYAIDLGAEPAKLAKNVPTSAVLATSPEGFTNISQLGSEIGASVQALGIQLQAAAADLTAALDAGSLATLVNPGDLAGLIDPGAFTEIPAMLMSLMP